MRCPRLIDLPPPQAKTDWPWTEEFPQLPDRMPGGSPWPRISIVTPSFNQGTFIEETIRSVLLQGYPDLEFIIMDGGSQDRSVDVIKKYEKWLTHWESRSDRGQSHAINKGWRKSSGDIVGWVNSDDFLLAGTLERLALTNLLNPEKTIFAGDVFNLYMTAQGGTQLIRQAGYSLDKFVKFWESWKEPGFMWHQPGVFFTKSVIIEVGLLDESLTYAFDYDYMCRALKSVPVCYLGEPLACFRVHPDSKTSRQEPLVLFELLQTSKRYWPILNLKNCRTGRKFVIERSLVLISRLNIKHNLRFLSHVISKCLWTDPVETIRLFSKKLFKEIRGVLPV